jgi:hypothetical protein
MTSYNWEACLKRANELSADDQWDQALIGTYMKENLSRNTFYANVITLGYWMSNRLNAIGEPLSMQDCRDFVEKTLDCSHKFKYR